MIEEKLQNLPKKYTYLYLIIAIGVCLLAVLCLSWHWFGTLIIQENTTFLFLNNHRVKEDPEVLLKLKRVKPEKYEAKGVYLTAYSAGNPSVINNIIDLINKTELNAVVIDIKDYSGLVLYDSQAPLVNELDAEHNRLGNVASLIKKLHEHDIYVIARQTVFQDPVLAEKKSEWAIKSKLGGLWRDDKGLAWVDPTQKAVWDYNLAIAKEAIRFGFDEINFDYVRFPSDGDMRQVVYTNQTQTKEEVMHTFYHYLSEELSNEPAWLSLDMFGFVMERDDGLYIGQRIQDAVDEVDYISPMMYPSHYPPNHRGLANPADYPGLVVGWGMEAGIAKFEGKRAQVRPWLQAFNLGAQYDAAKIRAQIDAVEKYDNAGWMLWNAANRYSANGLRVEEK